jgi:hypothetical protein
MNTLLAQRDALESEANAIVSELTCPGPDGAPPAGVKDPLVVGSLSPHLVYLEVKFGLCFKNSSTMISLPPEFSLPSLLSVLISSEFRTQRGSPVVTLTSYE